MNYSNYIFVFILFLIVLYMFAYLNNGCPSGYIYLLFILSCHCLRRCVLRLSLGEHVLRAQEGNLASTYLPVSPLSQSCGLSVNWYPVLYPDFSWYPVRYPDFSWCPDFQLLPWLSAGTLCGTLNFGWHPLSAHWCPPRDLTSKELACTHIPWVTSRLTLQEFTHTLDSLGE